MTFSNARSRPLSAADIKPRERVSVSTLPSVVRFASKLADSAGGVLSVLGEAPWQVTLDRIEDDIPDVLAEAGSWFRVESRNGSMTMHIALDRNAAAALCDAAMGGTGMEAAYELPDRPLSRIEKSLVQAALSHLETKVTTLLAEQLETPVSQIDGLAAQDEASAGDGRITFRLRVNLFDYTGELHLTASRREVVTQFGSAGEESSLVMAQDEQRAGLQRRIAAADLTFSVALGPEKVLVEDIANLAPGRHLKLLSTTQTPVIVSSEGNPVFSASLARSGDHLAVRIIAAVE